MSKKDEQIARMKGLMTYGIQTASKKNPVNESFEGADGNIYAIIREGAKYYIKSTPKGNELVQESFNYIGGFMNKRNNEYSSYNQASKNLELKLRSLNESYGVNKSVELLNPEKKENLMVEMTDAMKASLARYRQIINNTCSIMQESAVISPSNTGTPEAPKTSAFSPKIGEPFTNTAEASLDKDLKATSDNPEKQGEPFGDNSKTEEYKDAQYVPQGSVANQKPSGGKVVRVNENEEYEETIEECDEWGSCGLPTNAGVGNVGDTSPFEQVVKENTEDVVGFDDENTIEEENNEEDSDLELDDIDMDLDGEESEDVDDIDIDDIDDSEDSEDEEVEDFEDEEIEDNGVEEDEIESLKSEIEELKSMIHALMNDENEEDEYELELDDEEGFDNDEEGFDNDEEGFDNEEEGFDDEEQSFDNEEKEDFEDEFDTMEESCHKVNEGIEHDVLLSGDDVNPYDMAYPQKPWYIHTILQSYRDKMKGQISPLRMRNLIAIGGLVPKLIKMEQEVKNISKNYQNGEDVDTEKWELIVTAMQNNYRMLKNGIKKLDYLEPEDVKELNKYLDIINKRIGKYVIEYEEMFNNMEEDDEVEDIDINDEDWYNNEEESDIELDDIDFNSYDDMFDSVTPRRINENGTRLKVFGKHPGYRKKPMTLPTTGSDEGDWNDTSVYSEQPFGEKIGSSAPFDKIISPVVDAVMESIKKKL